MTIIASRTPRRGFANHPPRLSTIILLCAMSLLPLSIFLPSLPTIARDLHTDYALVGLSLAGYTVIAVTLEMITGPLSDRFGRRPIMLACLGIFVFGSIGCALATDIWSFLAFRLLQATITSGYPISMVTIKDMSTKEQAMSRIGYVATAAAFAPMVGPTVGGLIDQVFGWRAIFWGLSLVGIGMFALCWFQLGETNKSLVGTYEQQFRAYAGVLGEHLFWAYALCMAFSAGTFYAFLAGTPLAAQVEFDIRPATLGLYMGAVTAGYMLGSFMVGHYASRYDLTTTMIVGRFIACRGPVIALALLLAGAHHVTALFGPCVLIGIGNGMTNPSANVGILSVRPGLAGSVSGLAGAITIAGGALFSSITGAIITESNASYAPLCIMFVATLGALLAALYARFLEKSRE